jgi:hypothetical protein
MAGWATAIGTFLGGLASVYNATKSNKGFAPAADVGGGQKTQFSVPSDLFPSNTSLLGGNKPELSQALMAQNTPPPTQNYGPQGVTPFDQYNMQQRIQGMGRGK